MVPANIYRKLFLYKYIQVYIKKYIIKMFAHNIHCVCVSFFSGLFIHYIWDYRKQTFDFTRFLNIYHIYKLYNIQYIFKIWKYGSENKGTKFNKVYVFFFGFLDFFFVTRYLYNTKKNAKKRKSICVEKAFVSYTYIK